MPYIYYIVSLVPNSLTVTKAAIIRSKFNINTKNIHSPILDKANFQFAINKQEVFYNGPGQFNDLGSDFIMEFYLKVAENTPIYDALGDIAVQMTGLSVI